MPAKDFTELIAWQRADELERFALDIIKRPILACDKTFCEQTSDAAGSAPRNIAEGHGRFAPVQFANFLRVAIASEQETRNQIIKAWQRGAITDSEKRDGLILCKRALSSAIRLRAYLQTEEAKANAKAIEIRQAGDRRRPSPADSELANDEPANDEPANHEPANHEPKEPLNP
jgi:four helix bundle protein